MADFKDKISHIIKHQVPEFVLEDHPFFLDFIKEYYKFLECAEVKLKDIGAPNTLLLETETSNINRILLNSTNRQKRDDGDREQMSYLIFYIPLSATLGNPHIKG